MRFMTIPASVCAGLFLTSFASAQELTPGKYSGSMNIQQGRISIVLDIQSVENGTVQGKGERHGTDQSGLRFQRGCIGGFPLTGTVKGDTVDLRSAEKFGSAGDCQFRIRGTVSGDKILGKIGANDIELSK